MACYLGFDYGARRVGIAASDERASLAFALRTHVRGRDGSLMAAVRALAAERGAVGLVVGLPLTADGREAAAAAQARAFAERLRREVALPVVMWDERYSSVEAERSLRRGKRIAREATDAVAAQIILQSYLDSLRAAQGDPSAQAAPPAPDPREPA